MATRRVGPQQRAHVRAWKKSSLTARHYAEQERISHWSLYGWASAMNRMPATEEAPSFLPVRVVEAAVSVQAPAEGPASAAGSQVDLMLGNGRVVRVRSGFDPETLSRVIEVAEGV